MGLRTGPFVFYRHVCTKRHTWTRIDNSEYHNERLPLGEHTIDDCNIGNVVKAPLGSRNVMLRLPVATRVLVAASTPIVAPSCQKAVGETGPDRDAGMTVLKVAGAFSLVALTVTVPFTLLFVMFRETNDVE